VVVVQEDLEPAEPFVPVALSALCPWQTLEGQPADETPMPEITDIVADFVAALEDVEEEPADPRHADADSELWMPLSFRSGAVWPRLDSSPSRPRATQDEWGLFDPEQCGFSALVAKLDQMTR
jgi:hypothetical protein